MSKIVKCYICEDKLNKVAIGLNKKLLSWDVNRFCCLSCLANYLDVTVEDLLAKAEEFKEQGCKLF